VQDAIGYYADTILQDTEKGANAIQKRLAVVIDKMEAFLQRQADAQALATVEAAQVIITANAANTDRIVASNKKAALK
jgi:hypothetical protein